MSTLLEEVARRRNLAIISHPDAGKTTLTEKLLLYGGAINQAGAVKAKGEQRRATSDFMQIEQDRGISISSTVLTYDYLGKRVNVLDTPGHQDFSEDTYRTLAAADNAVMLVDGAKGLEPQTRKLFEVARLRRLPLFTFVNKLDRPALSPYEIIDQIESEFGVTCCPLLWPIGCGDRFKGVLDRRDNSVHMFGRGARGKQAEELETLSMDDEKLQEVIGDPQLYSQLLEDVEVLDGLIEPLDMARVMKGEVTPVFFGSAMTNFGVKLFLDSFLEIGTPPMARALDSKSEEFSDGAISEDAEVVDPTCEEFSAFVFKLQANLDPKHRDRLAYMRICSGSFTKGMKVKHSRLAGKEMILSSAQSMLGNDRTTVEDASFPGDVIGINNPSGTLAIGDTLYTGSRRISYTKIPSFSPEVFARCVNPTPSKSKQFNKGMAQLVAEGAVQQLLERGEEEVGAVPILAAVGPLQLEVVSSRMQSEYSCVISFEPLPYQYARWAMAGWEAMDEAQAEGKLMNVRKLQDGYGRPVILFPSEWRLNTAMSELGDKLQLRPYALAPDIEAKRKSKK